MKAIISQLQTIQLHDLPIIPLWYNGLWSQVSNAVWTNWPSSTSGSPTTCRSRGTATGRWAPCSMLTEIKLTPSSKQLTRDDPPLPPHAGGGAGLSV